MIHRGTHRVGVFQRLIDGLTANAAHVLRSEYALAVREVLRTLTRELVGAAAVVGDRGYQKAHPLSFGLKV